MRCQKFSISTINKKLLKPQVLLESNNSLDKTHSNESLVKCLESDDSVDLEKEFCAVIPLEGEFLSYVHLNFDNKLKRKALIDTGSCANAIPEKLLDEMQIEKVKLSFVEPRYKSVKMASGSPVVIDKAVRLTLYIANYQFTDDLLVLPTMNSVILLGNPFFKKNSIWICPSNNLLKLPDMTVQLNEFRPENEKPKFLKKLKIPIFLNKKHAIPPNSHAVLECTLKENSDSFSGCSGVVIPNDEFENSTEILLTSSLSSIDEHGKIMISAVNITEHYVHFKANTMVASFEILSQFQADQLIQIDPQLIALAKMQDPNNLENGLNQLVQMNCSEKMSSRPPPEYGKLWFATPETCLNPESLPPLKREIFDQINHFQTLESINPKSSHDDREKFLENFKWEQSILKREQKSEVENLLVEFSDIFAKHRFDVG